MTEAMPGGRNLALILRRVPRGALNDEEKRFFDSANTRIDEIRAVLMDHRRHLDLLVDDVGRLERRRGG